MNNYEIIDMEVWNRKDHFKLFRKSALPQFCVNFDLDVTGFYNAVKENNWSFTLAMVYVTTKVASEIENFRYRFLDGEVVLYQKIDTSFAWLNKETELFKYVFVPMQDNIDDYVKLARETADNQKEYFVCPPPNDTYSFSPLPWVTFTSKTHTYGGNSENAIPIFDWGKFYKKHDKLIMPFSVQAHHCFADGFHVGKLAEKLQEYLDSFK